MQLVLLLVCLIKSQSTHAGLRIYGGRDAYDNEFPFAVAIKYQVTTRDESGETRLQYTPLCSGALISPTWCLTAAHCIQLDSNKNLITLPPERKLVLTYQDLSKISEVTWGIRHPYFKESSIRDMYPNDDIGLLRSEPMVVKQYAKLSAVEYTTLMGFEVTSVGYGISQSQYKYTPPYFNTSLKVLKAVIIPCSKQVRGTMRGICISHECANVGVMCGGDSGSPLLHTSGVIAVIALGHPVCEVTKDYNSMLVSHGISSAVAVPISSHIDWIFKIITDRNHVNTT